MDDKGLKIGIIGVGQAGCNIADEFAQMGYKTIAINTSSTDLNLLKHVHKNNQLLINIGLQGAGKNPDIGRESLEKNIGDVFDMVKKVFDDIDKLYVCGGLGGGTASGMTALLCDILTEQGFDVGSIVTLPSKIEAPRVHMVALYAFEELSAVENLTTTFVIDNQKGSDILPNAGIRAKYKAINSTIVRLIDTVNKYSLKPSDIAFDPRDLDVALSQRGCALINQIPIDNIDDLKNDITLSSLLKKALSENILADTDFTAAQSAVFLFELPSGASYYLNEQSMHNMISEIGNPFDVFFGVYEDKDENKNKNKTGMLTVMITGLPFPTDRLDKIQQNLEQNEQIFTEKLDKNQNQKFKTRTNFMEKFNKTNQTKTKKDSSKQSTLEKLLSKNNANKNK